MKRFYILFLLFSLLINSCSSPSQSAITPEQPTVEINDNAKSLDAALSDMYLFWDAAYGQEATKSQNYSRPVIDKVATCHNLITKSDSGESNDKLAYIVNFKDNTGYSILSATKTGAPIIALTEKGAIDPDKLIERVYSQKALEENLKITEEEF